MSETIAIVSGLRTLSDDELLIVAGGQDNTPKPVRVCVRDCIQITRKDGTTELQCKPPVCGPPPPQR